MEIAQTKYGKRRARAGTAKRVVSVLMALAMLALSGCLQATIMGQRPAGTSTSLGTSALQISPANRIFSANESYPISVTGGQSENQLFSVISGDGTIDLSPVGPIYVAPDSDDSTEVEVMAGGQSATAMFKTTAFSQVSDQQWTEMIPGSSAVANASAVDSKGNLYVAGTASDAWVVREWNGMTWSTVDLFQYPGASTSQAQGIGIDPSNNIYVSGFVIDGSGYYHWIVRAWNGSAWSTSDDFQSSGQAWDAWAPSVVSDKLGNIYVAGTVGTTVSGNNYLNQFVREWNGSSWSTVYEINFASDFTPLDLAADKSGNIYAVGLTSGDTWSVGEWTGTSWASLGPNLGYSSGFSIGVDSQGNIYVQGTVWQTGYAEVSTVWEWNGSTWNTVDTYIYPNQTINYLGANELTIDSSDNVYIGFAPLDSSNVQHWVVRKGKGTSWSNIDDEIIQGDGAYSALAADQNGNVYQAGVGTGAGYSWIVEEWSGSSWTTIDDYYGGGPGPATGSVNGVFADASGNVYGAGNYNGTGGAHWMVNEYNGSAWSTLDDYQYSSRQSSSATSLAQDSLQNLYAGGYGYDSSGLIHWVVKVSNAGSWSVSDDFTGAGMGAQVSALAADNSGDVFAVGYGADGSGIQHWLVREWNGTAWSTVDDYTGPFGTTNGAQASGVAADTRGNVYVSGVEWDSTGLSWFVVRMWNGSVWTEIDEYAGPSGGQGASAQAIGVDSAGNVYAGGMEIDSAGNLYNLLRYWNGSSWTIVDDNLPVGGGATGIMSLKVDAVGSVYTSSLDNAGNVRIRKWNGYSATTSEVLTPASGDSYQPAYLSINPAAGIVSYLTGFYVGSSNSTQWVLGRQP